MLRHRDEKNEKKIDKKNQTLLCGVQSYLITTSATVITPIDHRNKK